MMPMLSPEFGPTVASEGVLRALGSDNFVPSHITALPRLKIPTILYLMRGFFVLF